MIPSVGRLHREIKSSSFRRNNEGKDSQYEMYSRVIIIYIYKTLHIIAKKRK